MNDSLWVLWDSVDFWRGYAISQTVTLLIGIALMCRR